MGKYLDLANKALRQLKRDRDIVTKGPAVWVSVDEYKELPDQLVQQLALLNNQMIAATGLPPRTAHRLTSTGTMLYSVRKLND